MKQSFNFQNGKEKVGVTLGKDLHITKLQKVRIQHHREKKVFGSYFSITLRLMEYFVLETTLSHLQQACSVDIK